MYYIIGSRARWRSFISITRLTFLECDGQRVMYCTLLLLQQRIKAFASGHARIGPLDYILRCGQMVVRKTRYHRGERRAEEGSPSVDNVPCGR